MSKHTLDPCPFCGEQPEINHIEAHSHYFQIDGFKMPDYPGSCVVECACGAGLIDSDFNTVATRWNTRAMSLPEVTIIEINTEVLRKENEQLRERITEIERISYSARCALQADVNDRDEVIANCSDKIRILESKLAALKGGAA